jgi:hypothetical protein
MSSFPPKQWRLRHLQDMDSMAIKARDGDSISLETLLAMPPADGEEGTFRFVLAGNHHLSFSLPVHSVLPIPSFEEWSLEAEWEIGTQVKIAKNSCCSTWTDLVELVASQDLDVVDKAGENRSDDFLETLDQFRKTGEQAQNSGKKTRINTAF